MPAVLSSSSPNDQNTETRLKPVPTWRFSANLKQRRKLGDGELFRACVRGQARFPQNVFRPRAQPRAQIVAQRFPFLRETFLHEIEKCVFVLDGILRARSGHAETYQRGRNFGRRPERPWRNPERDLRPAEPLRNHGEITVIAASRLRDDSHRNLELNHDMNGRDPVRVLEEAVQNGRSNVVRQISVNGKALAACQFLKIDSHHIAFDDFHVSA